MNHLQKKKEQLMKQTGFRQLFSFPIDSFVSVITHEPDEWIIQEGRRPESLFYIVTGKTKIYVTHQNGKVSLLNIMGERDFMGEMELFHDHYHTKGIQAISRTTCFALPYRACREKLLNDATFLRHLARFLSIKSTTMATKYAQSSFPLENRLAAFILQTAVEGLYKEAHVVVCDYFGVSYRHLLHVISQFCDKGYLQKVGRHYVVIERDGLLHLAALLEKE